MSKKSAPETSENNLKYIGNDKIIVTVYHESATSATINNYRLRHPHENRFSRQSQIDRIISDVPF
jgi:hypothetical protein